MILETTDQYKTIFKNRLQKSLDTIIDENHADGIKK